MVCAYYNDHGATDAGAAYLISGGTTGTLGLGDAARMAGEAAGDYACITLDGGADVNDDGYDDAVIGATYEATGGSDAGAAYVVLGPISADMSLADADAKLCGAANDRASRVALGDLDDDGHADVIVGAHYADSGATDSGTTYLVYGPVTVTAALSGAAALEGTGAAYYSGRAVSATGDVDADGYIDLLVSSQRDSGFGVTSGGAAYLVAGGAR